MWDHCSITTIQWMGTEPNQLMLTVKLLFQCSYLCFCFISYIVIMVTIARYCVCTLNLKNTRIPHSLKQVSHTGFAASKTSSPTLFVQSFWHGVERPAVGIKVHTKHKTNFWRKYYHHLSVVTTKYCKLRPDFLKSTYNIHNITCKWHWIFWEVPSQSG